MSRKRWQRIQRHVEARPDGIPGDETAKAIERKLGLVDADAAPSGWPVDRGGEQRELYNFYGQRGENLTTLVLPYPMQLDWEPYTVIEEFSINKRCHDAFKELFTRVREGYGLDAIRELKLDRFGGCYNNRKKRGGSTWSTHAWAAAVDLWPSGNQLHWDHTRAAFAKPEYDLFWNHVSEVGLIGLGPERDFDWMHIQAVALS